MAKYEDNAHKRWTPQEEHQLRKMAMQNYPTRVAALKLQRPVSGVYKKAAELRISLKPTNQSPYNRHR